MTETTTTIIDAGPWLDACGITGAILAGNPAPAFDAMRRLWPKSPPAAPQARFDLFFRCWQMLIPDPGNNDVLFTPTASAVVKRTHGATRGGQTSDMMAALVA